MISKLGRRGTLAALGRDKSVPPTGLETASYPEAVQRLRREIRLAAQLSHPNIVLAYDAAQVGDRHVLVMEYCAGQDLGHLVRHHGPPPVSLACEDRKQAACGLQHAFARGLVQRAIKPENLLVTGTTLKILDFGLAWLREPARPTPDGTRTQEGVVLGPPDYLAPELARNLRAADIRADLYRLGCTFYFVLTGRVPFPGGTALEKILRHQVETAVPLERQWPDVPPPVAATVNKLMAQIPADRSLTPAELAGGLEPVARPGSTCPPALASQHQEATLAWPQAEHGGRPGWPEGGDWLSRWSRPGVGLADRRVAGHVAVAPGLRPGRGVLARWQGPGHGRR